MNKRTVKISESEDSNCLTVELINTLGVSFAKYKFFNYIDYGDNLAKTCFEWVIFGFFPSESLMGLIKLDNSNQIKSKKL